MCKVDHGDYDGYLPESPLPNRIQLASRIAQAMQAMLMD